MGTLSEFAINSLWTYMCMSWFVCLCLHVCMQSVSLPLCIRPQCEHSVCVCVCVCVSLVADSGGVVSQRT